VKLIEPDVSGKRQRIVTERLRHPDEFDPEQVKITLKQLRTRAVENLEKLKTKFKRNFQNIQTTRGHKLSYHFATDSANAVKYIKKVCGKNLNVSFNKSSTVQELLLDLKRSKFKINDTYTDELKLEGIDKFEPSNYWETPKIDQMLVWDSLSISREVKMDPELRSESKKGTVGLLGVNTVSAESGSIFLVQHLHNITRLINASDKLIFVIGLEKLLNSDTDAWFQAKCCGLFGLDNILEELFSIKGEPDAGPLKKSKRKGKTTAAEEDLLNFSRPSELHIIILDNGRSELIGTRFQSLLECIGCKACSRMCPRVRQGKRIKPGLDIPTNPRDILLSGFNRGLEFATENGLYECTTCGNCENLCPIDIPLPDLTLRMRELCVKEGLVPASYNRVSENIEARGNPYLSD